MTWRELRALSAFVLGLVVVSLIASIPAFAQSMSFSPTCGPAGTNVCVTGSGWAEPEPVCYYRFYFNGAVAAPDQPDGLFGPPHQNITVPAVAPGDYPIQVDLRLSSDNSLLQTKQSGDTFFDFNFPFFHTIPSFKVVSANADPWTPPPPAGSTINITFDPKNVCDVSPCSKIVFIQVRQPTGVKADNTTRSLSFAEQGFSNAATLDADVINGRLVDYIVGEGDPYYNGDDTSDIGVQGIQNSTTVAATMNDTPKRSDSAYPADIVKIRLNFEVAAFCAAGDDKGKYFGRLFWTWERAKGAAGFTGTISGVTTDRLAPTAGFIDAVNKWNTNHGFTTKFPMPVASQCP
jgi:hypothetical protein